MLRQDHFLKGPVRSVVTERFLKHGTQIEELVFNSDGHLIELTNLTSDGHEFQEHFNYDRAGRRIRKDAELISQNNGGWKEIQKLHLDTWSLEQLGAGIRYE